MDYRNLSTSCEFLDRFFMESKDLPDRRGVSEAVRAAVGIDSIAPVVVAESAQCWRCSFTATYKCVQWPQAVCERRPYLRIGSTTFVTFPCDTQNSTIKKTDEILVLHVLLFVVVEAFHYDSSIGTLVLLLGLLVLMARDYRRTFAHQTPWVAIFKKTRTKLWYAAKLLGYGVLIFGFVGTGYELCIAFYTALKPKPVHRLITLYDAHMSKVAQYVSDGRVEEDHGAIWFYDCVTGVHIHLHGNYTVRNADKTIYNDPHTCKAKQ
jgi:hypothetical protein